MNRLLVIMNVLFFSLMCAENMIVIGHRGACGYEPENTLSSFRKALDMGVAMIELDVYVCATGELVVIHDDTVDRTTNGHGAVGAITFDQLRRLIVQGTEKIPTLQEVIDMLDGRVPLDIELKGPGTAQPVAKLLTTYLDRGWKRDDFVVSSFDHAQIDTFHKLLPSVKTGLLFDGSVKNKLRRLLSGCISYRILNYLLGDEAQEMVQAARQHHATFVGIGVHAIYPEIVTAAHAAGFQVFVWTVNDPKKADELRAWHVDGIFSNYPDIM